MQGATVLQHCEFSMNYFTVYLTGSSSGRAATVFIDGYITNPQGVNNIHTWLKNGQTVSAVGLLYSHPEGDSDVSVPVLRVRNCDEIVNVSGGTSTPPSGSNDSGSSGGSSSHGSSSTRSVSVSSTKNGSVSFSPSNPAKGAKVTLTVRPNSGYVLDSIKVLDSKGVEVELTAKDNNQFTFTMPSGKVTVDAKFVSKDSAASAPSFPTFPAVIGPARKSPGLLKRASCRASGMASLLPNAQLPASSFGWSWPV